MWTWIVGFTLSSTSPTKWWQEGKIKRSTVYGGSPATSAFLKRVERSNLANGPAVLIFDVGCNTVRFRSRWRRT